MNRLLRWISACGHALVTGMIHVPVDNLLRAPKRWLDYLELPEISPGERTLLRQISEAIDSGRKEAEQEIVETQCFAFLRERAFQEIEILLANHFHGIVLENTGPPYSIAPRIDPIVVAVMKLLVREIRNRYPSLLTGIQILAGGAKEALGIALEHDLDFVRGEGLLFQASRPEGTLENHPDLAELFRIRSEHRGQNSPLILVDVQKKHTHFPIVELQRKVTPWVEAALFTKLDGMIITGSQTGTPPSPQELQQWQYQLRLALPPERDHLKPLLVIGSGVTTHNLHNFLHHTDLLIIGSALKKDGFWEKPIDPQRVQHFSRLIPPCDPPA